MVLGRAGSLQICNANHHTKKKKQHGHMIGTTRNNALLYALGYGSDLDHILLTRTTRLGTIHRHVTIHVKSWIGLGQHFFNKNIKARPGTIKHVKISKIWDSPAGTICARRFWSVPYPPS